MDRSVLIFLIIGAPLILVSLGFLALCLKWMWTKNQRADHGKLLEAARLLDGRLAGLEIRLTALEDILLGAPRPAPQPQDPKLRSFDAELNKT
jgi:hypothetical protein